MCVYEISEVANLVISAVRTIDMVQEVRLAKEQSKYETKELIKQAERAENKAAIERQDGIEEARRQKLSSILNMQKEKATFAANNIATTSQIALNTIQDENTLGELTALNTLKQAERKSDDYLFSANDYYEKATLLSYKGQQSYKNLFANLKI